MCSSYHSCTTSIPYSVAWNNNHLIISLGLWIRNGDIIVQQNLLEVVRKTHELGRCNDWGLESLEGFCNLRVLYLSLEEVRQGLFIRCTYASPTLVIFCSHLFFDSSHPNGCELALYCVFYFHIPNVYWCWASLHVPVGCLCILFGEISIQVFYTFF